MASLASNFVHNRSSRSGGKLAKPQLAQRADCHCLEAQIGDCHKRALRHRVHHTRLRQHVHDLAAASRRLAEHRFADAADHGPLDDWIAQQLAGDALDVVERKLSFNEIPVPDRGLDRRIQSELGRLGRKGAAARGSGCPAAG